MIQYVVVVIVVVGDDVEGAAAIQPAVGRSVGQASLVDCRRCPAADAIPHPKTPLPPPTGQRCTCSAQMAGELESQAGRMTSATVS